MAKRLRVEVVAERGTGNLRLAPADAYSAELLEGLRREKFYNLTISEERSRGRLNHWWAGIGLLRENIDDERFPTSRHLHHAILEELGCVTRFYRIDGTFKTEADSIALDAMSEEEFEEIFERARALAVSEWGYDPWQLWQQEAEAKKQAKILAQRRLAMTTERRQEKETGGDDE